LIVVTLIVRDVSFILLFVFFLVWLFPNKALHLDGRFSDKKRDMFAWLSSRAVCNRNS
jgi:hypothetical protein